MLPQELHLKQNLEADLLLRKFSAIRKLEAHFFYYEFYFKLILSQLKQ